MSSDDRVELLSPSQIKKEPIMDCEYWFRDSESFLLILDLEKKIPQRGLIGRQKVRTGLAGFSSIPPVWCSFNILTKSVKFHPWFGCVEGSALNPVKVFRMLQILYFLRQFLRIKTKITFLIYIINYEKSTCIAQFQINF